MKDAMTYEALNSLAERMGMPDGFVIDDYAAARHFAKVFNKRVGEVALSLRRTAQMEANRAALPKPPAYARELGDELNCEPGPIMRVRSTPQSLLAQLWEMGVMCDTCEYKVGKTTAESACPTFRQVLFCAHWDHE